MPDFGFVGQAYEAPSIYQDAQELINWYCEIDPTKPQEARGVIALYPTPGLVEKIQLNLAEVRCIYTLTGGLEALIVCGNTLYSVSASLVATSKGTLLTAGGLVYISDNGTDAYICDGINRYSYSISSGTLTVLNDGGFTGGGRVDYVDGFFVYNRPDTNQWGSTSSLSTASPALSFTSDDSAIGNIVSIIADHREVRVISETSTESWINAGLFPFPFQKIQGTLTQHGCAAKDSVARLGESVAWVSQDTRGQAVVIMMNGYQPQRISTHAVENDISKGVISDARAFTYQQGGHEFYVLTFPSQDKTWVYDLATQMWHKRAWRDDDNNLHRIRANCHAVFQGIHLVGDFENGKVYQLDNQTYTDDGDPILRMRRCPHLTNELKRVFYHSLQLQFQPGVGLETGQGTDPQIMLRWSNDGGSTWSSYHTVSIGVLGAYRNRAIFRRLGYARDRIFEVTITDPVNAVVVSANLETSPGAH